jgi:glycosyltransferase involved in cell wall biosynthesis
MKTQLTGLRQIAIIYGSFWTTILVVRMSIFFLQFWNITPAIRAGSVHFHHFGVGFLVLCAALYFYRRPSVAPEVSAMLFGVSFGLIADEFLYWSLLRFDYWNFFNFFATVVVGVILLVFYHRLSQSELGNDTPVSHSNPENPKISVVIPAFNEAKFIRRTLGSLAKQTYRNFELIVVDNASTDDTAKIAAELGAKVILESIRGVAAARQAGFAAARGEIIATTDADTLLPKNWLKQIVSKFESDPDLAGFGGLYRLHSGSLSAKLAFPDIAYLFWLLDRGVRGGWSLAGANMAVRKTAFEKVGGFNTSLKIMEDCDLSQRLRQTGKVLFDRNFLVSTSGRRYRKGLIGGARKYLPTIRAQTELENVRIERVSRLSLLKPLIPALLLILPFLFHNTAVVEAKEKTEDSISFRTEVKRMASFVASSKKHIHFKFRKHGRQKPLSNV